MQTIRCILIAGAATVLAVLAILMIRPPEGNGFISESGALIFTVVGSFIFVFPVFWFPSMLIGCFVGRKILSDSQRSLHVAFTVISAIVFVSMICFVVSLRKYH